MINEPTGRSPRRKKRSKGKVVLITLIILLSLICIPLVIGGATFLYYVKDAPKLEFSKLEDTLSSTLYDAKGNPFLTLGEKKRETIAPNEIPPTLKDAIISIEDKRFEKHMGVDPIRIAGAALSNLKGNSRQGGSTLTQQLIKLSYFSHKQEDQTIKRKAQEAWLSVELEKKKSKDEILTYYINRVFMSNGVYGMKTAAETFYGKDFNDLTLAQYALLAGMPQSPMDYDPYVHPDYAKTRRDMVLKEMLKDKKISEADYNAAVAEPIDNGLVALKEDSTIQRVTDNYYKEVIAEVQKKTNKNIYTDGLDVYTNIDLESQTYLYNLVNNDSSSIDFPDDKFQVAGTLIDVKTGHVKAQIGGRNIAEDTQLSFNKAVENKRDFGSTTKPLVAYAPVIENLNYGSGEIYIDEPYNYKSNGKPVYNYDHQYRGRLTMRESLIDSRNIPALKALDEVGTDKSQEFIKKLGFDNEVYEGTAISMQGSPNQLAAAYAAFANGGIYYEPSYVSKIVYSDGTEETFEPNGDRAMKESTAYIITDMLKDVINEGTATPVQIPTVIQAGKTGTSNYADDAWDKVKGDGVPDITFAGYTPKYSFAVWTGYDDYFTPIPLYSQQLAMDIYRNYMTFLYQNLEATDWKQPDDVVRSGREVYLKDFVGSQNTKTSKSVSSSSTETSSTTSKSSTSEAPKESESTPVTPPPTSETVPPSTSSDVTPPTETTPSETTPSTGTNPPTSSSGPPEGSEKPAG
ncbi:PBP1A family penicillin-binding protein [Vagococcus fluvialis]|uniref:PBP1A family penicillin-binding protein n=1 Tax=Vagococcus fluvialis TaxID=2738 RepID=UPI0037D35A5F